MFSVSARGAKTKSETGKPIYALLRLGAEAQYPGKPVAVETYYLSSGKRVLVPDDDDEALLSQYAEAIEGIESRAFRAEARASHLPELPVLLRLPLLNF